MAARVGSDKMAQQRGAKGKVNVSFLVRQRRAAATRLLPALCVCACVCVRVCVCFLFNRHVSLPLVRLFSFRFSLSLSSFSLSLSLLPTTQMPALFQVATSLSKSRWRLWSGFVSLTLLHPRSALSHLASSLPLFTHTHTHTYTHMHISFSLSLFLCFSLSPTLLSLSALATPASSSHLSSLLSVRLGTIGAKVPAGAEVRHPTAVAATHACACVRAFVAFRRALPALGPPTPPCLPSESPAETHARRLKPTPLTSQGQSMASSRARRKRRSASTQSAPRRTSPTLTTTTRRLSATRTSL